MTTDLFPTFAHVARTKMPSHVRIDGSSALPALLGTHVCLYAFIFAYRFHYLYL
jgi:hypothetical protein